MHPSGEAPSGRLRVLSSDWWRQVLGLLLGPGLVYAYSIAVSSNYLSERWLSFHTHGYLLHYLLEIAFYAGFLCLWLWLVLRFVCGERLRSLNRKSGSLWTDLVHGCAIFFLTLVVSHYSLSLLRTHFHTGETTAVYGMTRAAALSPIHFWLELGPGIWLMAAMREEFMRVMLLSRLWKLGGSMPYQLATVGLSAVLFGLCHAYQGTTGFIDATIAGVILGSYYLIYGRPWALILVHGLRDSFWLLGSVAHYLTVHGSVH